MFFFKTDHFTGNLGANTIEHVSEMELYNILSTIKLETLESDSFNHKISVDEMVVGA